MDGSVHLGMHIWVRTTCLYSVNQPALADMQDVQVCLESGAQTVVGRSYMQVALQLLRGRTADAFWYTEYTGTTNTQISGYAAAPSCCWPIYLAASSHPSAGQGSVQSVCLTNGTARWTVSVHPFPRLDVPKMNHDRALFLWCLSPMLSYRILGGGEKSDRFAAGVAIPTGISSTRIELARIFLF